MAESTLEKLQEQYGERITVNEDGAISWTLGTSLKCADGEIGVITLRRPKVKELKKMKGASDTDKTVWMISALSGIAPPFLDDMDGEDFAVLGRVFSHFMGVSPPTGAA